MPKFPQHSSGHPITSGFTALVWAEPDSQQPHSSPSPTTSEFQPSATKTATKDLQEGALPGAFAQTLFARECGESSMTFAAVVNDTGIITVKFPFCLIYSDQAVDHVFFFPEFF